MAMQRKRIRLGSRDYIGLRWFFITICCSDHQPHFVSTSLCENSIELLRREGSTASFQVVAYCFMPDHLHLLLESTTPSCNLIRFIKLFKQKSGFEFAQVTRRKLWQRHFYDHILRSQDAPISVAYYIWLNPVRAGLCIAPQDYPYSGSFTMNWRSHLSQPETWTPPWRLHVAESPKSFT